MLSRNVTSPIFFKIASFLTFIADCNELYQKPVFCNSRDKCSLPFASEKLPLLLTRFFITFKSISSTDIWWYLIIWWELVLETNSNKQEYQTTWIYPDKIISISLLFFKSLQKKTSCCSKSACETNSTREVIRMIRRLEWLDKVYSSLNQ